MKKEYSEMYENLYADYIYEIEYRRRRPYPNDEYYILKTIRKSIDRADKESRLRPDAKYFLIVNFHHLIIRPLLEQRLNRAYQLDENFPTLEDDILSDISTIVNESMKESEQIEISGHHIMSTIDRIWKNLKTTKLEIWG